MRKRMKGLRKLSQRGGRRPKEGRGKPKRKSVEHVMSPVIQIRTRNWSLDGGKQESLVFATEPRIPEMKDRGNRAWERCTEDGRREKYPAPLILRPSIGDPQPVKTWKLDFTISASPPKLPTVTSGLVYVS